MALQSLYNHSFTGWGSRGFVVLLGFLQVNVILFARLHNKLRGYEAIYTLEGCETAAQVAEEAKRAEVLAPLAVVGSIAGSWIIGLAYMLVLLFSVQSIASVQATTYAIPIAQLFFDAVGPRLAILCLVVVAIAQVTASVTAFTASSRLFYALARDNAFPAREKFMALNRFQAPYWGVWTSVFIGCILSCAYIGSAIAVRACYIASLDNHIDRLTVQCHVVICGDICDAQLLTTHHHPSILAGLVSGKSLVSEVL